MRIGLFSWETLHSVAVGEHWLNERTKWIWRPLHHAYQRMRENVVASAGRHDALLHRALQQAARELMLAQSSDWPFAITNGTTEHDAKRRLLDHLARFHDLTSEIERRCVDPRKLAAPESMDAIFPDIGHELFAPPSMDFDLPPTDRFAG